MTTDLFVRTYDRGDPRLGRVIVHDPASKGFPLTAPIDKSTWRDKSIRVYDPLPNPNQTIGNCTGCSKCTQMNAVGNRVTGQVLDMRIADSIYSLATTLDPFDGSYPPVDTGSSTLAAAKAAQRIGIGGEYRWEFRGADGVVQHVMNGAVVVVGTDFDWDMFHPDSQGRIHPGGGVAGGHAWSARGYWLERDWVLMRCWWGEFRDVWLARPDLDGLLHRTGADAHVQQRLLSR